MKTIYKEKIIPHIKEDMYNLVANVSSYPDFVPYCSETEILEDDGAQVLASVSLNFHGLAKKFTTRNTMQPHECIKMTLVGGPLNKLDGSWKFEYISDSSSRIILQIDYEVTSYVYATVFDTVIATVSEQILLSFEKRAASIYG